MHAAHAKAVQAQTEADARQDELQGQAETLQSDIAKAEQTAKDAIERLSDAEQQARTALERLPGSYAARIRPADGASQEAEIADCLASEYPTPTEVDDLKTEQTGLQGADEEGKRLQEAQRDQKDRLQRLIGIAAEMDAIPPEARRPAEEVQAEIEACGQERAAAHDEKEAAEGQRRDLETRREDILRLQKEGAEAVRQRDLYKRLADLLGREYLQYFLLRQAEESIIAHANEVLSRISAGTLRLAERQEKKSGSDRGQALDLEAFNAEVAQAPIGIEYLSGSQRFRVAVSLALGIGRYATAGRQRIQSVIIDEGFGSLDKEGRREMIGELNSLSDVLDKIIVVSHQDDFADAFTHCYEITLENQTSVANAVVRA